MRQVLQTFSTRQALVSSATEGHVVVISHEVVGSRMAGPGIRYYNLARILARTFPVVLAVPDGSSLESSTDFMVLAYSGGQDPVLEGAISEARAVLVAAVWLSRATSLLQTTVPLVIDGYDPFSAESFFLRGDAEAQQAILTQAYLAGDFFICASERQRDWWLGVLEANGRINRYTYAEDSSLRRLIDLVPFGLPDVPPQHTRRTIKEVWPGVGEGDRVILWGGGLWPWLDPVTAIRAVAQVWESHKDVRLIFPGTRHPNPGMAGIPTHNDAARELAKRFGLLDKAVFFGDWVPYDDWQNVLLESDIALTLHYADALETRLAFRSRVLDYIWAGLPIVATRGDATSELIAAHEIGVLVESQDADSVADAILRLWDIPTATLSERFEKARDSLTWERAARPLIDFCRQPRRAPDKVALGERLGNPFYTNELARLQTLIQAYERRRAVRWVNQTQEFKARLCRRC